MGLLPKDVAGQTAVSDSDVWTKRPDGTEMNQDGLIRDKNGKVYGTPTAANQVASTGQLSRNEQDATAGYRTREGQDYANQAEFAGHLRALASGRGPTVAGTQLAIGMDQAANQQLAQAAGAGGSNGALARMQAMKNTGTMQAATNQQAALARAAEASEANRALGATLTNMGNQSAGMTKQATDAAQNYNKQANDLEAAREGLSLDADKASSSALASGAGMGLMALASDRREKTDIKPADMGSFLDALKPYTFTYKDPSKADTAPGERVGIMAQDAAPTKVGQTFVSKSDGDGHLQLDVGNGLGAALAGLADVNKRLKKVESR
jgi:hypothetical protein